jgi:hypothetical protein
MDMQDCCQMDLHSRGDSHRIGAGDNRVLLCPRSELMHSIQQIRPMMSKSQMKREEGQAWEGKEWERDVRSNWAREEAYLGPHRKALELVAGTCVLHPSAGEPTGKSHQVVAQGRESYPALLLPSLSSLVRAPRPNR